MVEFSEFVRFVLPILILLAFFLFRGEFFGFLSTLLLGGIFWFFWFNLLR